MEIYRTRIMPALARGQTVVLDRWIMSAVVYASLRDSDLDPYEMIQELPLPDMTILIDTPIEIVLHRLISRSRTNIYTTAEQLHQTRALFYRHIHRCTRQHRIITP